MMETKVGKVNFLVGVDLIFKGHWWSSFLSVSNNVSEKKIMKYKYLFQNDN